MARQISVKPVRREQPELDQFVAALLAMATERLNKEKAERVAREAGGEDL
jgi:hypothetical protein